MKIVCISDTHYTDKHLLDLPIPNGDVLIHAGDATMRGEVGETAHFMNWFASQPHAVKIFVPGNHDWWFERAGQGYQWSDDVRTLINEFYEFEFNGTIYTVFGSPWSLKFNNWAFNVTEKQMNTMFQSVLPLTKPLDILITHGPPYSIMDFYGAQHINKDGTVLGRGEYLGSKAVQAFVNQTKPKLHIFGHIHSMHGVQTKGPTTFINAAILDDDYKVVNKPILVEL